MITKITKSIDHKLIKVEFATLKYGLDFYSNGKRCNDFIFIKNGYQIIDDDTVITFEFIDDDLELINDYHD